MPDRRTFLAAAGAGLAGSLVRLDRFLPLSPSQAEDAQATPDLVSLRPEIEPLVRLIEETPREKCFEMATEQLRAGMPYRQFLAALFLAGIRNVNPYHLPSPATPDSPLMQRAVEAVRGL